VCGEFLCVVIDVIYNKLAATSQHLYVYFLQVCKADVVYNNITAMSERCELDDLVVEPVEITSCDNEPDCEVTDLTILPEKLVASIEASGMIASFCCSEL